MALLVHLVTQALAFCIFFLLTRHPDFHEERWRKIIWSQCLVASITATMLDEIPAILFVAASFGAFGLLAITWAGHFSEMSAKSLLNFFYRDVHSYTGLRADFKYAINHRRDGELDEAIEAAQQELVKEPKNFEGLLLLAQIYQDQNKPEEAMTPLQNILNNPAISESQRALAQNEMANCKRLVDLLAIEEFNKRPNT